jgi:Cft2 family RNA processing exonuclease
MPPSPVHFTSLGSVGEVGASAHVVQMHGLTILLDCGMHPKHEGRQALPDFTHLPAPPDAIIVTHGHVDHCGTLPYLLRQYPGAIPYATPATVRILDRMLNNSVTVMERLRLEQGIEDYPLYTREDVARAMRRIYAIDYHRPFGLRPQNPVRVTLTPAGHVLGAASVRIAGPDHTVFYTADICTSEQELLGAYEPPENPAAIDTLIVESTYGANPEADTLDYNQEIKKFGDGLREVLRRDGSVLVPAFALGRTQEVLNIVTRLQSQGRVPVVPVYASGLGRAIYEIYMRFEHDLKPRAEITPLHEFRSVGDVWDPAVLHRLLAEPCIIVATSGMMIENTPSAVIAEEMVTERKHGIFFVGYCDPETLGHKVKHAVPGDELIFRTGGRPVRVRNETIRWYHFSAHAHRAALCGVIDSIPSRNVIFVHGDAPALEWMMENAGNGRTKFAPRIGERIALEAKS